MRAKLIHRRNSRTRIGTTGSERKQFLRRLLFEALDVRLPLDADDALSEALSLGNASTTPSVKNDSISPDTDVDMYRISVNAGQTVDFDIDTVANGPGGLGSFLRLFNSSGTELAFNNDGRAPGETTVGFDAYLRFTFPSAGTFYVSVSNNTNTLFNPTTGNGDQAGGANSTGTYQLIATALPVDDDDTLTEAIPLSSVTSSPDIENDTIETDIDVDLYRFSVTTGETVDFDIDTPTNGGAGLDSFLRIFNSSGQEIGFVDDAPGVGENVVGFDAYMRFTFATAGTYYVGVSNVNNTLYNASTGGNDTAGGPNSIGAYTLTVQTAPVDPNDTDDQMTEATNLGSISGTTSPVTGAITPASDVDMYRFTAGAGQIIDFDIDTPTNGPGGLGSFIRLFNSTGTEIAFNNDASAPGEGAVGFDSYLRFTFTTAGTYYLGVSNNNNTLYNASTGGGDVSNNLNAVGNYTLTVQGLAVDSDDTLTEAPTLGSITTTPDVANDSISPDIDVDLYRFTATNGQVIDFDLDTTANGPGGVDAFLRLFNDAGQEIAFNDDGAAPGENILNFDSYIRFTFVAGGTYYVGVSNVNNTLYNPVTGANDAAGGANSTGAYTLNVQTAPTIPADPDDTLAEAPNLGAVSTTAIVTSGAAITPDSDVDLYRFTANAGQVVDFDLDTAQNGPGGLGGFLRLFNSSGAEIAFNNDGNAPGENTIGFDSYLRFTFGTSGTYYVGVSNANNTLYNVQTGDGDVTGGPNGTGNYSLSIQALPVDTDDTQSEATSLGTISGTPIVLDDNINPDIDVDLYRFTVTNGDTVDFDIDTTNNGPGGLGSFLRLFDSNGQEIAFNNDGAAPGETTLGFDAYIRHAFTTGGTYYVGVSNSNNTLYNTVNGGGDTAGGLNSIGSYRLVITLASGTPTDTNDQMGEAQVLGTPGTTPQTISSSITPSTDVNMYQITVTTNQTVNFDIDTATNGPGGLGSYLRLFNSSGTQIASNDDGAAPGETVLGFDAFLQFTFATPGTYYLGVSNNTNITYNPSTGSGDIANGANATGNYQLIVSSPAAGTPTLSISATVGTIAEPAGSTTGTVVRSNANITQPLVVNLTSNDTTEATVPATVTIPANQTSVTFTITAADDTLIDGTQNVTITAAATGFTSANLPIQVTDNEVSASTLALSVVASSISETNGTTQGTVVRNSSNITQPLVVNLSSNDTTEATVPATVTIPANQTSINFTITAVDDAIVDGTQSVTISATATGFTGATVGVQVTDNDATASTLALSVVASSISETNGTTLGTVTRNSSNITQPLVVTLSSNDTTEATVPATVTIPANQTSVNFTITAVDDAIVDGTQSVTISATATGFSGANVGLQVTDNDVTPVLGLSIVASSISELNGTTTATVTRNSTNLSQPLVVNLSSNDTTEATVPATVTIPANQNSVNFAITAVDDAIVDGTQTVTISATAIGFTAANAGLQVTDNDNAQTLALSAVSLSISETNGTTTGTVTRNTANISQPLVVNLVSNDTTEATVPATVTIPANQISATFTITAVDDLIVDGSQTVTITASATGLTSANLSLLVTDNDSLWQNPDDPLDVNDDGDITAFDVIPIINILNQFGSQPVPSTGSPPPYLDVNSDNQITAFDAIPIINWLNLHPVPGSGGGEFVASGGEETAERTANEQSLVADMVFAELGAQREKELRSAQQNRE